MNPKEKTTTVFKKHFGDTPTHCFRAPGRVNLIGEHTDYNDGFVLPCAINYETVIAVSARDDDKISLVAADMGEQTNNFAIEAPIPQDKNALWSNYIRGVAQVFLQRGYKFKGANIALSGNVPLGAGLSSSASLEVVIGTALNHLNGLDIEARDIALIGQQAENEFVGVNCGIMDQYISALGKKDHALLIDCRSLDYKAVSIPVGTAIIIANSNVKHSLVDSEYNTRRQECETAAAHFGVPALRDVPPDEFALHEDELDETVAKRARHVITENARTEAAAEALSQGNLQQMSHLMAESHASMRDDFEITIPEIDALVQIISGVIGSQGGVRMTGGGFGGCVVSLVPQGLVGPVEAVIAEKYPAIAGRQATVYVCKASAGAGIC